MQWTFKDEGLGSAASNMENDALLLSEMGPSSPCLARFYTWEERSASYGYFTEPADYFNESVVKDLGIKLVRRPTGGGVIFHCNDWTLSLFLPCVHPCYAMATVDAYRYLNTLVGKALCKAGLLSESSFHLEEKKTPSRRGGFCMAESTIYDIVFGGKKIAGAAQRKTKAGLLHQVSVCLKAPDPVWLTPGLMKNREWSAQILKTSHPLAPFEDDLSRLRQCLNASFQEEASKADNPVFFTNDRPLV